MKIIKYLVVLMLSVFVADFYGMQGQPVEVYFLPQHRREVKDKLDSLIDGAHGQILIAMYWATDLTILNKIIARKKRVRDSGREFDVQVISDETCSNNDQFVDLLLANHITPVIYPSNTLNGVRGVGKMHNKFLVIDGTHVVTGSANFTGAAFDLNSARPNFENVTIFNSNEIARQYIDNFYQIEREIFDLYAKIKDANNRPGWLNRLLPSLYRDNRRFKAQQAALVAPRQAAPLAPQPVVAPAPIRAAPSVPQQVAPPASRQAAPLIPFKPVIPFQKAVLGRRGIPWQGMSYDEAYPIVRQILDEEEAAEDASEERALGGERPRKKGKKEKRAQKEDQKKRTIHKYQDEYNY